MLLVERNTGIMESRQRKMRNWYIGVCIVMLLCIGLGGLVWMKFLSAQKNAPSVSTPAITPAATTVRGIALDRDARLLIPAIGVNAPIEAVGQDEQGRMAVPMKHHWSGVGWYRGGPVPGTPGSAVLDGHLDTDTGAPAVFWKLHALHIGDVVMLQDSSGYKAQFHVTKIQNYTVDQAPLDVIFHKNDGAYLNLITCSGSWDYAQNQFQQRLVVFTKRVA